MMKMLCIMLIGSGAFIILRSTIDYCKLLVAQKKRLKPQKLFGDCMRAVCLVTMIFFLIGYTGILVIYAISGFASIWDILTAVLFFLSSVLVLAMVTIARRMFQTISEIEKLLREKEEAEQTDRSESICLSHLSHDTRTLMNSIIGMARIGRTSFDIERKNYTCEKIELASKQLLAVVDDMQDLLKIESNKLELSYTVFSFEKMLAKIVNDISPRVKEKKQRFIISTAKDVPDIINCDEQRLSQIIMILLGNAVKHTPQGGIVSLIIRTLPENGGACVLQFEVKDTGAGISEECLKNVFTFFEQAGDCPAHSNGRKGLSLVISKKLVEMMGGDIEARSEEGRGASFIFSICAPIPQSDRYTNKSIMANATRTA